MSLYEAHALEHPQPSTFSTVLYDSVRKQREQMDLICLQAITHNCGVRLTYHEDGGYTVAVDKDLPPRTLHTVGNPQFPVLSDYRWVVN